MNANKLIAVMNIVLGFGFGLFAFVTNDLFFLVFGLYPLIIGIGLGTLTCIDKKLQQNGT
jgi:membrane protein implicated in regulation of membrane protease activity